MCTPKASYSYLRTPALCIYSAIRTVMKKWRTRNQMKRCMIRRRCYVTGSGWMLWGRGIKLKKIGLWWERAWSKGNLYLVLGNKKLQANDFISASSFEAAFHQLLYPSLSSAASNHCKDTQYIQQTSLNCHEILIINLSLGKTKNFSAFRNGPRR